DAQLADPLAIPAEPDGDRLGERGDSCAVAVRPVALLERARDRDEHAETHSAPRGGVLPRFAPPPPPVMEPDEEEDRRDRADADPEIALRRLDDRFAEVVGEQPDQAAPGGSAEDVPEEEAGEAHPCDARHPAERRPHHGNEATEEDGLRAVLVEELLRPLDALVRDALEPLPARQELPPPAAADDEREQRPEHRCGERERDDRRDAAVPLRGERRRGDQGGLAGDEGQPGDLEEDDPEDDPEPVMGDEMRHVGTNYRARGMRQITEGPDRALT